MPLYKAMKQKKLIKNRIVVRQDKTLVYKGMLYRVPNEITPGESIDVLNLIDSRLGFLRVDTAQWYYNLEILGRAKPVKKRIKGTKNE